MITIRPELTTKNVLARVDSLDIFKRYCSGFSHLDKKFKDRPDDSKPSAVITFWNGDYLFKDFGSTGSYRAVPYVAYKLGISYVSALKLINKDFQLGLGNDEESNTLLEVPPKPIIKNVDSNLLTTRKCPVGIKVKRRAVVAKDIEFWENFGWTKRLLEAGRIFPITHFWITNPRKELFNYKIKVDEHKLAYTFDYYFHEGIFRRKLYFPGEEDNKFLSNADYTVVQGYPTLPRTGDILIVTSSLKDCGPFWRLGYPTIAPNSENEFFYETFVNKLKSRFRRIVIWFDNDSAGIKHGKEFAGFYDLEYICNPEDTAKDPSDYVYKYGIEEFKKLVLHSLAKTLKIFK